MKEEQKQLEALRKRITDTWALLDIDGMRKKYEKLETQMQASDFWQDQEKATRVSKQHENLRSDVESWKTLRDEVVELLGLVGDLLENPDEEMTTELQKRVEEVTAQYEKKEFLVLMNEKYDVNNAIVTFHGGSGGTEAQDWAEMLMRMIMRYAEKKGWDVTLVYESRGGEAGIKSATVRVEGRYAFGHLKSEHGTHRLVRISPFDAEKMRHTSFALIEVIPELGDEEEIQIDTKDLRIDTFMAGGNGGQSVNTTYSAVRIVHVPTGITVQCQNERSQLQNKQTALKILQARLQKAEDEKRAEEKKELRGEYKSAEWGNQIRSYVLHPYKMVKDLRSKYEVQDPQAVLDGELDSFVEAYLRWQKKKD